MEDFPSNSHSKKAAKDGEKTAKPRVTRVTTGEVVQRKKPLGKRFMETFVGGDAKSAAGSVLWDVLVPSAKEMIVDAGVETLERLFFGEPRSSRGRSRGRGGLSTFVNYQRMSRSTYDKREEPRQRMSRQARMNHDFREIILDSRAEAEMVIDRLFDLVSQYEVARVSDLYDLVDLEKTYADDKWGWTDLRGTSAVRVRSGGYLIDIPQPEYLGD